MRPNKPLNTALGIMMGAMIGLIVGVTGTGLIAAGKKHRALSTALNS